MLCRRFNVADSMRDCQPIKAVSPASVVRVRDPETGRLDVRATVDTPGGELIVWTPTAAETHDVVLDGPADLRTFPVGDGRVLVATVDAAGDYGLSVVRRPE